MTIYMRAADIEAMTAEHTKKHYFVGLDLGQAADYTAVSVLERVKVPVLRPGPMPEVPEYDTIHHITMLERLPLRTTYPDVVDYVRRLMDTAPLAGNANLVIDMTGVGRPVYDLFVQAKLQPTGISITAGDTWSSEGRVYRVSKKLLISTLDAAMHNRKVFAAPLLPQAEVLRSELADLRRKFSDSGYQQIEARSGRHDDMVLSVAVALWYAVTVGTRTVKFVPYVF